MTYFTQDDHNAVLTLSVAENSNAAALERVHQRLMSLYQVLIPEIKKHQLDLHAVPVLADAVQTQTIAARSPMESLSVVYMRAAEDAANIERTMGRDVSGYEQVKYQHHPVIELRLTPDYFAVELLVAPEAWYDQRNLVGKMSISQHRQRFYQLLGALKDDYMIGFWSGIHVDDMHLNTAKFPPPQLVFEFLDTFAPGRDYFRIGRWYKTDEEVSAASVLNNIKDLYSIYDFILWTGNNNFHSFYQKSLARG